MEGGYGRVVGRLKEMIIRDNTNIFPVEIEEFLMTHPDVMEVQVSQLCALLHLPTLRSSTQAELCFEVSMTVTINSSHYCVLSYNTRQCTRRLMQETKVHTQLPIFLSLCS
jgi:phenylacetate-coenzyme A ligase PaaK-like adenylate-forming protein